MSGKASLLLTLSLISNLCQAQAEGEKKDSCKKWFVPEGYFAEYGGGFGMVSAGMIFNPAGKLNVRTGAGYTPPAYGNIWTANLLLSHPVLPAVEYRNIRFRLLDAGAFASMNFGKNIHPVWPDQYPKGYYWWTSSLRYGPFLETGATVAFRNHAIGFFFQCLTNDLYLFTYLPNRETMSVADILVLGAGVKLYLFSSCNPK